MINDAEHLIQKYAEAREKQQEYKNSDGGRLYWKGVTDAYHALLINWFKGWADPGTTGYIVFYKEKTYAQALAELAQLSHEQFNSHKA